MKTRPSDLFNQSSNDDYLNTNSLAIIGNLPTTALLNFALNHLKSDMDATPKSEKHVLILATNRNSLASALVGENQFSDAGLSSHLLALLDKIDLKYGDLSTRLE
jgi:hypothetical protein